MVGSTIIDAKSNNAAHRTAWDGGRASHNGDRRILLELQ